MNGAALATSDYESSQSKISNGAASTTTSKRVSTSSNGGRRSHSSLSVGDTNSLLSGQTLKKGAQKRVNGSGTTVDGSQLSLKLQNNLVQSVKKSLAKTKRQWDRTGFIHIIYVLVLLAYSFIGGGLFMALDGPHADRILTAHKNRCIEDRERFWNELVANCSNLTFIECENQTRDTLMRLDHCFRTAPQVPFNHSTSNYWNSLIYAITVFTTIGYGNIVVLSTEGRIAVSASHMVWYASSILSRSVFFQMILYGMVGIPLFFAFLNDMGQWFHFKFLKIYAWVRRIWSNSRLYLIIMEMRRRRKLMPNGPNGGTTTDGGQRKSKQQDDDKDGRDGLIFTFAVGVLVFYLVVVCAFLVAVVRGQWSFFQAFYFLFQSISLIGFGDEFPDDPNIVLINITFIIIGIILLSMCFFILQEWIRGKTYRLSTQVRRSVRRWRHYAYRPGSHNILDPRRIKNTRFTVTLPHLGSPGEHWRRRGRRTEQNVAGQRLAVVDDCSPGPGRRAVVAVLTFDEEDHDRESAAVPRRPSPARRDGVHSVDETLITGHKWSSKTPVSFADGALEAEDAMFLKPGPYYGGYRLKDRRHTVVGLDELSAVVLDDRKRVPSWLKVKDQARRQKQKAEKVRKRLSFHDQPARFGKFQWIRQMHNEEEDEEEEEEDGDEACEEVEEDDEVVETETVTFGLQDVEKGEGSAYSDKDDYL